MFGAPMTDLLVDALCVFRLTRLVTRDTITAPFRDHLVREYGHDSKVVELVECGYCVSVWAALALPLVPRWLRRVLALSAVAGITATFT